MLIKKIKMLIKKIKIICLLATVFCFCNVDMMAFSGGSGTQADPYLISDETDWVTFRDSVHSSHRWSINKYFELSDDIDLTSLNFVVGPMPATAFYGNLNGNGFKLSVSVPLFGRIHTEGVVENLRVDGEIITDITGIGSSNIGSIAAIPPTLFSNCTSYVSIQSGNRVGGIAGENYGVITKSFNHGNVVASNGVVGGITGISYNTVSYCQNTGSISSPMGSFGSVNVGGVIGTVSNSSFYSPPDGVITSNNINIGVVRGERTVGGIIGGHFLV